MLNRQIGLDDWILAGQIEKKSVESNPDLNDLDPMQRLIMIITNPILRSYLQKCEFISLVDHVITIRSIDRLTIQWIRAHVRYIIKAALINIMRDPNLKILLIEDADHNDDHGGRG